MKREIDIQNWKRKEHFEFFNSFDEPFLGVVSEIDCTMAYNIAKKLEVPFFLFYLYKSLQAANELEEFRYRIEGDEVICFDEIHASPTVGREDETFAFSFMKFSTDFNEFIDGAKKEIEIVKSSSGLRLNDDSKRIDTIHYTTIPWFKINGLSHPRNFKFVDSVPKISFGKFEQVGTKKIMSVAIHAHHGLMDGYHVGKYFNVFQELMNI